MWHWKNTLDLFAVFFYNSMATLCVYLVTAVEFFRLPYFRSGTPTAKTRLTASTPAPDSHASDTPTAVKQLNRSLKQSCKVRNGHLIPMNEYFISISISPNLFCSYVWWWYEVSHVVQVYMCIYFMFHKLSVLAT